MFILKNLFQILTLLDNVISCERKWKNELQG